VADALLQIRGLRTHFKTDDGMLRAVDGVDLTIARGETLSLVGESGCGKTVTAMTVLKLIATPPGEIVAGHILWKGRDLVPLAADEMRRIRSREIAMSGCTMGSTEATQSTGRSRCCASSMCRRRSGGCTTTRTSYRAACGSAR